MYATYYFFWNYFGIKLLFTEYDNNFYLLCNAPTITHGDVKLQINYFDLLMYPYRLIIIMILLFFKYVYRFGTVFIQEIT